MFINVMTTYERSNMRFPNTSQIQPTARRSFCLSALIAAALVLGAAVPGLARGEDKEGERPDLRTYIVVLDKDAVALRRDNDKAVNRKVTRELTSTLVRGIAAESGLRPRAILANLGMFVVDATPEQAEKLAARREVASVSEDAPAEPSALPSCFNPTSFPLANSYNPTSPQPISCWDPQLSCTDSWALDRIDQHTGNQAAHTLDSKFYFGARGSGVHIYVVDTGIAPAHSEFANPAGGTRIGNGINIATYNMCVYGGGCGDGGSWDTTDGSGHGTLVASVAAGLRFGVAKSATIHPVRVSKSSGGSFSSWVALGLDWVAGNALRPAVVNLSWNFPVDSPTDPPAALDEAASRLINNYGIAIVNSAGNHREDAISYSPTRVPEVIVVGGLDWNNYLYGAGGPPCPGNGNQCGSDFGPSVDLFAPAVDVLGAMDDAFHSWACIGTGTSFAAPVVTGVVAQYLQSNPLATPATIQTVLIGKATTGAILGNLNFSPNRIVYTDF
jgi:subtilisin family serine protease